MKKIVFLLIASIIFSGSVISCSSCDDKKEKKDVVEECINADMKYMQNKYNDFVWYESSITLDKYLDDKDCDGTIESVTNIFQTGFNDSIVREKKVVMITHNGELFTVKEIQGFWCEDVVMTTDEIAFTFNQIYETYTEANCVKPHSRYCVLRNPLGPCLCNPQYIFGNANGSLAFMDALTGDYSETSPAFNCR